MTVRAKFQLTKSAELAWDKVARELTFDARYDDSIPEDHRYCKATPSGSFTMVCSNPLALDQFKVGEQYYFDITPAIKPVPASEADQPSSV